MATYLELYGKIADEPLIQKLSVAVLVACDTIRQEAESVPRHSGRVAWAVTAIKDPRTQATRALGLLLAQNKALTTTQIDNVTDANLQIAVDGLVSVLAGI